MEEWIRRNRERALESPVRQEILAALEAGDLSISELRDRLSGDLSVSEVNLHLARLQDADLVWAEHGRYWRVAR